MLCLLSKVDFSFIGKNAINESDHIFANNHSMFADEEFFLECLISFPVHCHVSKTLDYNIQLNVCL